MIARELNQLKVINARDAKAFEEAYNSAMLELAKFQPKGTFKLEEGSYYAIIEYVREVKIPEDARDEFKLQGVEYTCSTCPFFSLPDDKRIKKVLCKESGRQILCEAESPACVWLYEQIAAGEVNL